ncbi:MAG TPA: GntR family transcriptional regulator [Burkholderiales bacterium]|nr:GntR family transcriptional regulator [Burkholderiales bacterium]
MAAPAAKQSLAEEAYREIRDALLSGEIEPGQRLSEPELALRFNTSRSPVREALLRLEHEGFVERMPSGRVRVAALDVGYLEQLYVVRANLEGLAARLAAPLLRTVDLDAMTRSVDQMDRAVKNDDASGAIDAGQQFHDVLMRECGNEPLVSLLTALKGRIGRFRALVASLGDYDADRVLEHRLILQALYERNAERAQAEMISHVSQSAAVLVRRLRERAAARF